MRIGIDLGGTKIAGILMDARGQTRHSVRESTPAASGYEAIVSAVVGMIRGLEGHAGQPCTVGIGTPGVVSHVTGAMKNCNTTCLNGKPLKDDLERALGHPIRIANDANCFTLSEALDGAAAGKRIVFGVIIGTGVGGGISIAGHIHEGPNAIAGEWGHTPLEADGPDCYCGHKGCVETFLSGTGLFADYKRHGGTGAQSAREVVEAAAHDRGARAAVDRYVARFGRAMATVIDILDPDAIVLGGGMSNVQRLYEDGPKAVRREVFSDDLRTPILQHAHGDASGVRGAAMLWEATEGAPVRAKSAAKGRRAQGGG